MCSHIYDYFKYSQTTEIPSGLTKEEVKQADELVEKVREATEPKCSGKYATYTSTERARIGKYAAENGTTRAIRFFFTALLKCYFDHHERCMYMVFLNLLEEDHDYSFYYQ